MEFTEQHIIMEGSSWWDKRTSIERRFMVVTFILFLLVIGLVICLIAVLLRIEDQEQSWYYPNRFGYDLEPYREYANIINNEPYMLCVDPGCVHAASNILKFMDPSVDPCENFYKFSCGGFLNESSIPGDKKSFSSIDLNRRQLQRRLKSIFEEPTQYKDIKPVALAKRLYQQCMDTGAIERDNLQTIKALIKSLGGWPALEGYDWDENKFDWIQAVHKLRRYGFNENYFFRVEIYHEGDNSSQHTLVLDQAFIEPEEELFLLQGLGSEFSTLYYSYMVDIAVLLGADVTFAMNDMKTALEFEAALAKISVQNRNNDTFMYNTMTLSMLQTRYPNIPWLEYINGVIDLADYKATFQDPVIVRVPQYLADFDSLQRWNSKRVLASYLIWRVVKYSVNYLTAALRDRQAAFYRSAYNFKEKEPRWEECVNLVEKNMPFAVGFIYADRYIPKEAKEIVFEMVSSIRNELVELIRGVEWMDEITRISATEKAEALLTHAAYSEEFTSVKKLQKYYSELELPRNNYLRSVLHLNVFKRDRYFKKLRKYVLHSEWDESDYFAGVRPHYSVTLNKLNIPNGILQGIFFGTDRPQYLNYAGLGYLIGREITYGFDNTGRFYDKYGKNVDWWSEFTKRAFYQKTKCLSYQHRNRTAAEIDLILEGYNEKEEAIADQGGVKLAYFAYNIWVEHYGNEFQLPSLKQYTPQQLFWISAAQTHCEKYDPKTLKSDGYAQSPAQSRVRDAFDNLEYFSRDFNCHLGTAMNPVRKCHVW